MELDTLIAGLDPARLTGTPSADSPAADRLYRQITRGAGGARPFSGRPRAPRRKAPLAATAAVAVTAATLISLAGAAHPGRPAGPPGPLLVADLMPAATATAATAGMPPYYVIAEHDRPVAEVRSSASGKVLATVNLPPAADPKQAQITAAGGGRTFLLALAAFARTRFYRLRVGPDGHPARLSPLAVPAVVGGAMVDALAVSPDGSKLAVAIQDDSGHGRLEVLSLRTGAVRTWGSATAGAPWQLSWARNGRQLGFFWQDYSPRSGSPSASRSGLWVISTTAPGRGLLSGRRILPATVGSDQVSTAVLSPDGTRVIAVVTYNGAMRVGAGATVGGIVELSTRTGRPLSTLLAEHAGRSRHNGWYVTPCGLLAAGGTGQHLLVSCDQFGRLDRGRFTPLAGVPPQAAAAAAW